MELQVDGKPIRGFVIFADGVRTDEVRPRDAGHLTNDMTLQYLHVSPLANPKPTSKTDLYSLQWPSPTLPAPSPFSGDTIWMWAL